MNNKKSWTQYRYQQKRRKLLKTAVALTQLSGALMLNSACSTRPSAVATPTPTRTKPTPKSYAFCNLR